MQAVANAADRVASGSEPPAGLPDEVVWLMRSGDREDKVAAGVLNALGVPGSKYLEGMTGANNFVIWDAPSIEVIDRLNQQRRGFIRFSPVGDEKGPIVKASIHLLAGVDPTTQAHESSHFFHEVMGELVKRGVGGDSLKRDFDALVKWQGYESAEARSRDVLERRSLAAQTSRTPDEEARLKSLVAKEERLSHAWELYLAEGKAPHADLVPVFRKWRGWFLSVYRGLVGGPKAQFDYAYPGEKPLELAPEVRKIFDRILGAEEAVKRATDAQGQLPKAVIDGMPPEERAAYEKDLEESRQQATEEMIRRLAFENENANRKFRSAERERLIGEARAELAAKPEYRVLEGVRAEEGRLDRDKVVAEYGEEALKGLPRGIWAETGGISADEAAARFGGAEFPTGRELLASLMGLGRSLDSDAVKVANSRLRDLYGQGLDAGQDKTLAAAMRAINNDAASRNAVRELRAFQRELGQTAGRPIDLQIIRDQAEKLIAQKRLRDIQPGSLRLQERNALERAYDAASARDFQKAFDHRERALFFNQMARAADEARKSGDKVQAYVDRIGTMQWRQTLGKANPAYREAADAILSALGKSKVTQNIAQQLKAMQGLRDAARDYFQELAFDDDHVESVLANPKPMSEMTLEEATNVANALKGIYALAKQIVKLRVGEQTREKTDVIEEMGRVAAENLPLQPPIETRDPALKTTKHSLRTLFQGADAVLLEMERMIDFIGGEKGDSIFHQVFVRDFLAARKVRSELAEQYIGKISKLWDTLPAELQTRRAELIDLGPDLKLPGDAALKREEGKVSRTYLWMMALNWGSSGPSGNRDRLAKGYGWAPDAIESAFAKHMSAAEWKWVQGVWDSLDGLYPIMADLHEKDTGLRPDKIKSEPVIIDGVKVAEGGYFPARYDILTETRGVGQKQVEDAPTVSAVFGPSYQKPTTSKTAAQKRATGFYDRVSLDWGVVPAHLSQVIHDIAFRGYVKQVAGIITDKRFKDIVDLRLGAERGKQFLPWAKALANWQADSVAAHLKATKDMMTLGRGRAAIHAIGHSIPTALGDLTNPALAVAAGEVSPGYMTRGLVATLNWSDARAKVLLLSPEMLGRAKHLEENIRTQLERMNASSGRENEIVKAARDSAFEMMEFTDKLTSTPIWLAKHEQETARLVEEGMSLEAARAEAIHLADRTIRRLFPSHGDPASQAALLRDRHGLGGWLLFYGFSNKIYNVKRAIVHEAWNGWSEKTASEKTFSAARAAARTVAVAAVFGGASEFLSGRGPERDDKDRPKEGWGEWLLRKTLVDSFVGGIPFLAPIIEAAMTKGQSTGGRAAPALDVLASSAKAGAHLAENIHDIVMGGKAADPHKAFWDAIDLSGLVAGLPTRQIVRTGGYLTGDFSADVSAGRAGSVASGLIYGKRKSQATTPPAAIQEVLR
jgi:hypothetical protein